MNIDQFKEGTFDAFYEFSPLAWIRSSLSASHQQILKTQIHQDKKTSSKTIVPFNLSSFLSRGITAASLVAGASTAMVAANVITGISPSIMAPKVATIQTVAPYDLYISPITLAPAIAIDKISHHSEYGTSQITNYVSNFRNSIEAIGGSSAWRFEVLPPQVVKHSELAEGKPSINFLFEPTDSQLARLNFLGSHLRSLGQLLAYRGDDGEVILEAGKRGHSLTLFLQEDNTVAMYRQGTAYSLDRLKEFTYSRYPEAADLRGLAVNYQARLDLAELLDA